MINTRVSDLLRLDVSKHVEKKPTGNGVTLSYLSWAWAWDQALRADPNATFHVESWTDEKGTRCYMDVNGTAMVWVRVSMLGQTRTCMLPVMNSRNEPISIEGRTFKDKFGRDKTEKLDAFNLNTAIMRCLTKCLALFGLGLYIYAGEDLPADDLEIKDNKPETKPEPKPEQKTKAEDTPQKPSEASEKHQLLADGLTQAVVICKSPSGLKSLWKSNQTSLDDLEKHAPDLFARVKEVFTATRKELEKQNG